MINKYPSYSSIVEWANKLKDYELDNVYFSITGKPRVILKADPFTELRKLLADIRPNEWGLR